MKRQKNKWRGGRVKVKPTLSRLQRRLAKAHRTPAEFAMGVYACVPGDISMDEARVAIDKYTKAWNEL